MDKLSPAPMHCPHCGAAYGVVRVEAVTADPLPDKIPCKNCGGDLDTREGAFILKYFLISRRQRRKPVVRPSRLMVDAPRCPKCKQPMKLVDSLPAEGTLPSLKEFRCDGCNEEITLEVE